jgi:nucleoside-triphosphatase THEP1
MENFNQPGTSLIIAKSGSGKTTLISNIVAYLTEKRAIGGVILFSQTAKFNGDYSFLDKKLIFRELNIDMLANIQAKRAKLYSEGKKLPALLIILDDVVGDNELRSEKFSKLITTARHTNLYIVVSVQFVTVVKPILRDNANVVAITKIDNKARLRDYYELCGFGNLKEFEKYMDDEVGIYEFHVANRKCPSKKTEDCFCKVVPTLNIPKFRWS